mgnify:CR=1 FL=1
MNKYYNKKTSIKHNGEIYKFDSKKEAARFMFLICLLDQRKITDLRVHPSFLLQEKFTDAQGVKHRAIKYEADFKYFNREMNRTVIEDTKGFRTEVYKIKRKLFLKNLPIPTIFMEL